MVSMPLRTPLFEAHKKLGAQIVDFGGWDMPVYYTNILAEHNATRNACGLFDICHMGEFIVEGKEAFDFVQWFFSRDISGQRIGQMALGVLCNEQGGILDDLTVYRLSEEKFMVVVNASTAKKDFDFLLAQLKKKKFSCTLKDITMQTAKFDIQGPNAEKILQKLCRFDLSKFGFYNFVEEKKGLLGFDCIVSRSGYTGEDGFEVYFDWSKAIIVWEELLAQGKDEGIVPVGLGARDTLRLEAGYNLYGNELDEHTNPFECRYGWVVNGDKKDFVGKKAVFEQKEKGLQRRLVGFEMVERAIARHGYIVFVQGEKAGVVTSGSFSPTLKKNIGLCFVKPEFAKTGAEIHVEVRGQKFGAKIVELPFYKRK